MKTARQSNALLFFCIQSLRSLNYKVDGFLILFWRNMKLIFKLKSYIVLLQICGKCTMDINLKIYFCAVTTQKECRQGFEP